MLTYNELFQKPGLFKEQNADFSAQIHSVTLTKTWFKKSHDTFWWPYFWDGKGNNVSQNDHFLVEPDFPIKSVFYVLPKISLFYLQDSVYRRALCIRYLFIYQSLFMTERTLKNVFKSHLPPHYYHIKSFRKFVLLIQKGADSGGWEGGGGTRFWGVGTIDIFHQ